MDTIYYNANKLIKIKVLLKNKSDWWSWQSEKKLWNFFVIRREGFYRQFGDFSKEIPNENLYLENGIVYEKPHVILFFEDNHRTIKFYNTPTEAKGAAKDAQDLSGCNWLEVK